MRLLTVSAIGADRPGIVAGVTGVLVEQGCNLEDTSMTILRGHFTMTMVVASPAAEVDLVAALAPVGVELGLVIDVRPLDIASDEGTGGEEYVVAVHGADHPGIVHAVTALLARHSVNITDLTTRLVGEGAGSLYVMTLDVEVPEAVRPDDLEAQLRRTAADLGVTATLHAADADLL